MTVPSNGVSVRPATNPMSTSIALKPLPWRRGNRCKRRFDTRHRNIRSAVPMPKLTMSLNLKPIAGSTLTELASASRWLNIPTHGAFEVVLKPYGALMLMPK